MIVNLEGEIWADVVGYEGLYKVSTKGRMISCAKSWYAGNGGKRSKEETIMPPHYNTTLQGELGYNHQTLRGKSKAKDAKVCKLVAIAFIPNPKNKKCVNHIDGNKQNDDVTNLEWATYKENTQHAYRIGRMNGAKGSENGMAKLNEATVVKLRNLHSKGIKNEELALMFSIDESNVRQITSRRRWTHI